MSLRLVDSQFKYISEHEENNTLMQLIFDIIQKFKVSYFNQSLASSQTTRVLVNEMNLGIGLSLNKEQRRQLSESIVNDPALLLIVFDERFPNIVASDRKIK